MDGEEVYMENDPLALYLINEKLHDFEIVKTKLNEELKTCLPLKNEKSFQPEEELKSYIKDLLKSELLLEEDYYLLETYYLNSIGLNMDKSILKYLFSGTMTLIGLSFYKLTHFKLRKVIFPLFMLPALFDIYNFIKNYNKRRKISLLIFQLNTFRKSIKKSLQIVGELSATIGYYSASTISNLSLNTMHTRFAREFYFLLLNAIKLLVHQTSQIISAVPLTVVNNMRFEIKQDLLTKTDVTVSDIKLLSEIYLLVQSDFIKTLGLSFCTYLWVSPNADTKQILTKIIPFVSISLNEILKRLNTEYTILRNYGLRENSEKIRSPQTNRTSPLHYLNSCLHTSELHFQQLLCKSRDLQDIITEIDNRENEQIETVTKMLDEMDKQITTSKNMLDTIIKCFNQFIKRDSNADIQINSEIISNDTVKTIQSEQEEMTPDKLLYELYIPKEGLDLAEINIDTERPVFSMKDLDYSGVLLNELRAILKTRNPDVYQEEIAKPEINSDSEDDEYYYKSKRRDVFRPTQPVGLAENLQTISHVLNARKNTLQCEELCDDTYENSDTEEIVS